MATITTLLNTDSGSVSLGVINDNFEALNDDKIESDSADTLENKTIDVDDNTVTNLETDNFKSSAKSGLDTKVITGTPGAAEQLGKFNSDGDLVAAGVSVTTTAPATGALDTTIPTSQAVQEAIDAQLTKELFVLVAGGNTVASAYDTALGNFVLNTADSGENVYFMFKVPANFNSLTSAVVVMIPDATETIQYDLASSIVAVGESYASNNQSSDNLTASATTDVMLSVTVSAVLGGMVAGDYVALRFNSNITTLRVIGLTIVYA